MIAITRSSSSQLSSSSEVAVARHPTTRHDAAPVRRDPAAVGDRPARLGALADATVGRWATEGRIGLDAVVPALVRRPVEEEVEEYERWDGLA